MSRQSIPRAFLTAASLLAVGGCIQVPTRDPESYVNGMRLLAIKAEPPEVAAGETTTLNALIIDTKGRATDVAWAYCALRPPMGTRVSNDCVLNEQADYLFPFGSGSSTMFLMPTLDPSMLGTADNTNGIYLPLRAKVTGEDPALTAIYPLRVGMGGTANKNPRINNVYQVIAGAGMPTDGGGPMDGPISSGTNLLVPFDPAAPLVVHEGDRITLRALFASGSAERYMGTSFGGRDGGTMQPRTNTERLSLSWYSTAGTLGGPMFMMGGFGGMPDGGGGGSDADGGNPPSDGGMGMMGGGGFGGGGGGNQDAVLTLDRNLPPSGSSIDLWVVGRDNRGGTDYQHHTLTFQ